MIEARIICSSPCEIHDLGLTLQRGEETWVAYQVALRSADLRAEIGKGNVRMSRMTRKPGQPLPRHVPPFVALHRAPGPGVQPHAVRSVEPPKVDPPARPELDLEDLAQRLRAELLGDMRTTVAEEVSRAISSMPTAAGLDPSQIGAVLEGVLRRVLPAGGAIAAAPSAARASATTSADEPLYMPTNIVDKDAKGKVVLQSQSSEETGDLDDAAAALRELKRRRGRTNGDQENADE